MDAGEVTRGHWIIAYGRPTCGKSTYKSAQTPVNCEPPLFFFLSRLKAVQVWLDPANSHIDVKAGHLIRYVPD